MEPALLIYMTSSFIRWPVFQSMLYEKACLDEYSNGTVDCTNVSALRSDTRLHEYFNHLYLVSSLSLMIPSMFVAALLGSRELDSYQITSFNSVRLVALQGSHVGAIHRSHNQQLQLHLASRLHAMESLLADTKRRHIWTLWWLHLYHKHHLLLLDENNKVRIQKRKGCST
jgi:hypothetical protein